MATIVVTEPGTTVAVKNGDRVVVDIPGGGDVTIVAANSNARNFRIDYGDDDDVSDTVQVDVNTFTKPNLQIQAVGYDPSDQLILNGAVNQQVDPSSLNVVNFEYSGGLSGQAKILDSGERDLTENPPPIQICFAKGTIIDTELGPRPVESLLVGDLVRTVDRGLQPVRWIGGRTLDSVELAGAPHLRPVRISPGALGNGLPWTELVVSPQHRIRISDWRAQLLYGHAEVLVPAKALVGSPGIDVRGGSGVTYFHILFDRHELVWSNGVLSESLHPGEIAQSALGEDLVKALEAEFGREFHERETVRPALRVTDARVAAIFAA